MPARDPHESILGLVCGYAPKAFNRKYLVILEGYADESESGGTGQGNAYTLAGYISTAPNWIAFSKEWETVCDTEPMTPDFHMAKAWRIKGEYHWKSEDERDSKIAELAGVIQKWSKYRVDAVLSRPAYEFIVRGKLPKQIDDPYFICFYNAILASCNLLKKVGHEDVVDWIFDKQGPLMETQCVGWYHWVKQHMPPEISKYLGSTPIFRHDTELLPLKAADIYAWLVRRHLDLEQRQGIPMGERLERLLDAYGVSCQATPENLGELVQSGGMLLRQECLFHLPAS
jgi:hypothetical protein